jgi:hypothetical protein
MVRKGLLMGLYFDLCERCKKHRLWHNLLPWETVAVGKHFRDVRFATVEPKAIALNGGALNEVASD